jgi:Tol biopolymer transport system component
MSPEQARGKALDRRTDIWALGCILYEMLTGKPVFRGEDVTEILASVMKSEPDWSALAADTPTTISKLLRRCLEKDRKRRLADANDARLDIEEALTLPAGETMQASAAPRPSSNLVAWVAFAVVVLVAVGFAVPAVRHLREAHPTAERVRVDLTFPKGARPTERSVPALSPDGRRLAFVATSADGIARLWVRELDALDANFLSGTEGAFGSPFWSSDSREVVYLDRRVPSAIKLRRINASGGPSRIICDFPGLVLKGGFWTNSGEVVFGALGAMSSYSGLFRVPAAGGSAALMLSVAEGDTGYGYPSLLPDGRHFVFSRTSTKPERIGVFVGSLERPSEDQSLIKLLPDSYANTVYMPSGEQGGYLLFVREGTLMALPFDVNRLRVFGEPYVVAERVSVADPDKYSMFTATEGRVVYLEDGVLQDRQRLWLDRRGQITAHLGEPGYYGGVVLSRDGRRVAYQRLPSNDLWLIELERGGSSRFTTNGEANWAPVWSPDNRSIVFTSTRNGRARPFRKVVGGPDTEEQLLPSGWSLDWSSDGRFVLFRDLNDLWALPDPRVPGERTPIQLTHTAYAETDARFSPDGRWVAIQSDQSGQDEIYLRPFDDTASRPSIGETGTEISAGGGGTAPRWRADGRELFYMSGDRRMMAVSMTPDTDRGLRAGTPVALFTVPPRARWGWDVAPDGERFLVVEEANDAPPFRVIFNWHPERVK